MRERRGAGAGLVALAVGLPLLVAAIVMAVVFTGTGVVGRSPLHRAVDRYLEAVGGGGAAPAAGPGSGCPDGAPDPADALRGLAPRFGHHIVSSTESGDSAAVNVDLVPAGGDPAGGDPVAVLLELRRTGDRWDVCAASAGRMAVDPF
ncbi:hypothetical protein OHA91_34890 [Streptomyces erythrochromogenes]|uniref:Uncharacterized protein n=1 Tax=Streptomyces erythrochromogenes TaxID=285574 RepID=A0ABZ1QKN8_9ACTN|nr:hypothetical protein [Streptomyces erythrochromogenes]MCX5589365.1 hypothetical protein [Streptomyces erythrochromogenes]